MLEYVNYKELIDELYESQISEDPNENKQLQKTTANTVIGLLEKKQLINIQNPKFLLIYQPLDIIKLNMVVILQKLNNVSNSNHNQ